MKKDEALSNDPWRELAEGSDMKKIGLNEALEQLHAPEGEAPAVKRGILNKVRKLAKDATPPEVAAPAPKKKKSSK